MGSRHDLQPRGGGHGWKVGGSLSGETVKELPCPDLPTCSLPGQQKQDPPSGLLSEGTAASLFPSLGPGGLPEGPVLGTNMGLEPQGSRRPAQVRFCQTCNSRASLDCAIIYFNAFVVHVWVQVKYGPASFVYWWGC